MARPPIIDRLFARIDALSSELAAMTCDLVRFPTINPPGRSYAPALEYVARTLAPHGFSSRLLRAEGAPGDSDAHPRLNLLSRVEGARPGRTVHFNGHIDVVDAGPGWTVEPFEGVIRGGRVYGRGAADMKGGIAAAVLAATAVVDLVPDLAGAIELSVTADGKSGGLGGTGYLAAEGWFAAGRVDHVIIPEPHGIGRVCRGHRGLWAARVTMTGPGGHGALPFLAANPILGLGDFIGLIQTDLAPSLAARITRLPCIPEAARAASLNISAIHGGLPDGAGLPTPVVADSCRLVLERRYGPEEDLALVRQEIAALADIVADRHGLAVAVDELLSLPPALTDADAAVVRALERAVEDVTGRAADIVVSPGAYDQTHIQRLGAVRDCVAYGPGLAELAHQPDEWVSIDDMVTAAKVMAAATLQLTGTLD
jgi:succinyl-diaminopimelate desuccinylase